MNEERRRQLIAPHCPLAEEGYPAAYALGALDGEDLARFRAHLPTCPVCSAEVATFGVAAAQLPLLIDDGAPENEPSPALRGRILAAVAAEGANGRADAAPPAPLPFRGRRSWPQAYAVAAVLLLALGLSLLAWNLTIQRDLREARSERDQARAALAETRFQLAATGNQPISGEITYLPDRQQAMIVVSGLPALAPGQVYQLWLISGNNVQPSTVFLTPTTAVQANLLQYQTAAITIEPGPTGSTAPTMQPIAAAALAR